MERDVVDIHVNLRRFDLIATGVADTVDTAITRLIRLLTRRLTMVTRRAWKVTRKSGLKVRRLVMSCQMIGIFAVSAAGDILLFIFCGNSISKFLRLEQGGWGLGQCVWG